MSCSSFHNCIIHLDFLTAQCSVGRCLRWILSTRATFIPSLGSLNCLLPSQSLFLCDRRQPHSGFLLSLLNMSQPSLLFPPTQIRRWIRIVSVWSSEFFHPITKLAYITSHFTTLIYFSTTLWLLFVTVPWRSHPDTVPFISNISKNIREPQGVYGHTKMQLLSILSQF